MRIPGLAAAPQDRAYGAGAFNEHRSWRIYAITLSSERNELAYKLEIHSQQLSHGERLERRWRVFGVSFLYISVVYIFYYKHTYNREKQRNFILKNISPLHSHLEKEKYLRLKMSTLHFQEMPQRAGRGVWWGRGGEGRGGEGRSEKGGEEKGAENWEGEGEGRERGTGRLTRGAGRGGGRGGQAFV